MSIGILLSVKLLNDCGSQRLSEVLLAALKGQTAHHVSEQRCQNLSGAVGERRLTTHDGAKIRLDHLHDFVLRDWQRRNWQRRSHEQ